MAKWKNPNEGEEWAQCKRCGVTQPISHLTDKKFVDSEIGLETTGPVCVDRDWCSRALKEQLEQGKNDPQLAQASR